MTLVPSGHPNAFILVTEDPFEITYRMVNENELEKLIEKWNSKP